MGWSSIGGADNAWTGEWFAFFNVEHFYYDYPLTQKVDHPEILNLQLAFQTINYDTEMNTFFKKLKNRE